MTRKLSDSPAWKPMFLAFVICVPAAALVELFTRSYWGALCALPYFVLAVQVFAYGMKGDSR